MSFDNSQNLNMLDIHITETCSKITHISVSKYNLDKVKYDSMFRAPLIPNVCDMLADVRTNQYSTIIFMARVSTPP